MEDIDERDINHWIDCVGEDWKNHICRPHDKKIICGLQIIEKNPKQLMEFSCYECIF